MIVMRARRFLYNCIKDAMARIGFVKNASELEFIFTSSNGLYLYHDGHIHRILKGNYFGITQLPGNEFLAVKYVQRGTSDERSYAELFQIVGGKPVNRRPFIFRSSAGEIRVPVRVHQVVYYDGYVWITNTRQNLIWKCELTGQISQEWFYTESFDYDPHSLGTVSVRSRARNSSNYHHFNSITFSDGYMYVLAHNSAGIDKSRESFYLKLDADFNVLDRVDRLGTACHNLVPYEGDFFICDSGNGRIVHGKYPAINLGYFVRGLIIANKCLIAGGTLSSDDPSLRGRGDSRIFIVPIGSDRPIYAFSLGRTGDIHDILLLSRDAFE